MILLWLAGAALAIECPQHLTREDLLASIEKSEAAYAELDTIAFRDGMNELSGILLPCIGDLLPPELAARTHRLMAMRQLELGNDLAADASLGAAWTLAPDDPIPEAWVPPDHPLRAAWAAQPERMFQRVPEPRVGALAFDGVVGRERPRDLPTIAQVFDPAGVASATAYLGPEDPLPDYAAVPRTRNALIGAAAGSGAAGVALFVASLLQYQALIAKSGDPLLPRGPLDGARGATNGLYVAGAGLMGAGVGLGFGAAFVGEK